MAFSDPRLASVTVVSGPPGIQPGDELVHVEPVTIDGMAILLPVALPGVAEYVAAANSETEANRLRPQLTTDLDCRSTVPAQLNATLALNFNAAAGSAATSAMAGIEAFTNHQITRIAGAAGEIHYEGVTRTPSELWQWRIDQRVGAVLPQITGRPMPKQEPWWGTFRRVQALAALARHGITDAYKKAGLSGEKRLSQRYIDREHRGGAGMMLELFEHFAPGWMGSARLRELPPPP
jgi:hypothetical protein